MPNSFDQNYYTPGYAPPYPINPSATQVSLTAYPDYLNPLDLSRTLLTASATIDGTPSNGDIVTWNSTFGQIPSMTETAGGASTNYLTNPIYLGIASVTATVNGQSAYTTVTYYDERLSAPRVNNLEDGDILTGDAIRQGVQALIVRPITLEIGDNLTFYWNRFSTNKYYNGTNIPWVIDLNDFDLFDPSINLIDGEHRVYYVLRNEAGTFPSTPLIITVVGSPYSAPTFEPPTLPDIPDNRIGYNDAVAGVRILIPGGQPGIQNGDGFAITLALRSYANVPIRTFTVASGSILDAMGGTIAVINYADLRNLNNVIGRITYRVTNPITRITGISYYTDVLINTIVPS